MNPVQITTPATGMPSRKAGMSFVELVVVMAIMLVAMSIFSSTVATTGRQRSLNRDNAVAANAARTLIEQMRNEPLELVYALYNSDPSDDPGGAGMAPGNRFPVVGLSPVPEAADGMVAEAYFPSILADPGPPAVWELREGFEDRDLGMPRDLNGDNLIDDKDHSGDYILLPVEVRLQWNGAGGRRQFRIYSILVEFDA